MSMAMLQLFQTLALFVGVCFAVTVALAALVGALAALEPATVRITHPPTRRIIRRE